VSEPDRIDAHAHVTTHVADGLAAFMRAFRTKPRVQALARAWLKQIQDLEDTLWELLRQSDLEAAEGAQLDQIGELVQLARGTLTDLYYRPLLRAGIRARRSNGTGEDLIAIATLALQGSGITYSLREGHGSAVIEPHGHLPAGFADVFLRVLKLGKSGGVQLQLFTSPVELEAGLFALAPAGALLPVVDANRGLGADAGGTGGHLTGVLA
jgi:hypothetical protein